MDIQVNTIYLKDAKPYESKQCRYEIEATGLLPDKPTIREKERSVTRGITETARVRVAKHFDESVALDVI